MNKSEMVEAIAKQADLPKTKAEAALKAFIETTNRLRHILRCQAFCPHGSQSPDRRSHQD